MMNVEDALSHLKRNWTSVDSEIAFLGVGRLYQYYKGVLSLEQIRSVLEKRDGWSLMKIPRTVRKREKQNKFISYYIHDCWHVDTFDVSQLSEFNSGVKHIFTAIDLFSKKGYVVPLLSHTASDGIFALKTIFLINGVLPRNIGSDQGGECGSRKVREFLSRNGVNSVILTGNSKAGVVEIFQKTLQRLIYSYIVDTDQQSYISVLPQLVEGYNNKVHTTTGFSPNDVESNSEVQRIVERDNMKDVSQSILNKVKPTLRVGDAVRISYKKSKFLRSYKIQNTREVFYVRRVDVNNKIPRYFIKDYYGEDITGAFDRSELTKVNLSKVKSEVIAHKRFRDKFEELGGYKGDLVE